MKSLDRIILAALRNGAFEFGSDLIEPRFCKIGNLRLVRPVVDGQRWCLIVGDGHDHAKLGIAVHIALEWCRIGYQRKNKLKEG